MLDEVSQTSSEHDGLMQGTCIILRIVLGFLKSQYSACGTYGPSVPRRRGIIVVAVRVMVIVRVKRVRSKERREGRVLDFN